jgi:uncharacterized protein (DUF1778 family)
VLGKIANAHYSANNTLMKTAKTYTKKAMALTSVLIPERDKELWKAAAGNLGISQSEFLRTAVREKARRVIRQQRHNQIGELSGSQTA